METGTLSLLSLQRQNPDSIVGYPLERVVDFQSLISDKTTAPDIT